MLFILYGIHLLCDIQAYTTFIYNTNKYNNINDVCHEYSFLRAALRNGPTDVTSTVNSAQAPLRHTRASA